MNLLMPRLGKQEVTQILTDYQNNGIQFSDQHPRARFAPSGGSRVAPSQLKKLRESIINIAEHCNFSGQASQKDRSRFDYLAGIEFWTFMKDCPDALRDDIWAFIASVLLPDVADWRYPGFKAERYQGGLRNVFQRLWYRAEVLGRAEGHPERWELMNRLSEDALVAITERPAVAADSVLSKAVAEGWIRAADKFGSSAMEERMRRAIIRIRVGNLIQLFCFIDSEIERRDIIDRAFEL
jgi:hypothetical protein